MTDPSSPPPIEAPHDLHQEYARRLKLHEDALARWERIDARVADLRLAAFLAAAALGAFIYFNARPSWWWLAVPMSALVALILAHEPIRRRAVHAGRAIEFYRRGLARMED